MSRSKKKYTVWITILCMIYLTVILMAAAVLRSGRLIEFLEKKEERREESNNTEILTGENPEGTSVEVISEEVPMEEIISEEVISEEVLPGEEVQEEGLPAEGTVSGGETDSVPQTEEPAEGEHPMTMENSLFIGDSRTLGIKQYSGMDEAAYFARPGMSVYNIGKDKMKVFGDKELTFAEVLQYKNYDRVYVMLGINELGYDTATTVKRYSELLQQIQEAQPGAVIFIQANLHVTKVRNDLDEVFNNAAINNFNEKIKELADNEKIFYVDVNVLFDDADGNMDVAKSYDDTHVNPKYYLEWANWLKEQTEECLGLTEG